MSDGWDPRALGPYNLVGDAVLEGGLAIARNPGLDWSDPERPDPPGYKPEPWETLFDEAVRLLEARGRHVDAAPRRS